MASKRAIRRKACGKKKRYATPEDAKKVAWRTYRGLRPYKCEFCGQFHLGHVPGKVRRRSRLHA